MKARYKEFVVEVVETNGGWSTIQFADGMQRKVRNGEWVEMIEEKVEYTLAEALAEEQQIEQQESKIRRCCNTTYNPEHYVKAKSKSGHATLHNGDPIAMVWAEMTLDDIYEVAATVLSMNVNELRGKYAHLNPGMQRMNLGNRVRAAAKKAQA